MVPRSDSVPTGSPQAKHIPDWFRWIHPDLRLHENALIVVARVRGFSVKNARPRAGERYSIWESRWALTYLETLAAGNEKLWREIWNEVHHIEEEIGNIVRRIASEESPRSRKGRAS